VLIGRVTSVGPPPGGWSGAYAAWQRVDYQVLRWLKRPKSEAPPPEAVQVFHLVVARTRTADPTDPKLRETVFHPGAELILFIREKDSRYEVFDENYGVLPNEPKWREKVEHALAGAEAP
jgi:hypothetical protein